jgi:hypothetical protein
MGRLQTTRMNRKSFEPSPDYGHSKSEERSNAIDLFRWFIVIPIVWLLIFGCGALSVVGAAPPSPMDLLSRNQADYSPWKYVSIQPLRKGFLDEIKHDYSVLDLALSIFTQPSVASDPFIKPTESSVKVSVEVTATHTPPSLPTVAATATDGLGTDPTNSPTPSPTDDPSASPTLSPTPSRTGTTGPTSTSIPSSTATSSPTSTPTPTPSPSSTQTQGATLTPSVTPSTVPTQPINICSTYDYFHAHSPYANGNVIGFIVHAMPIEGPTTQVVVTGVTVNQDGGNPNILTVNKINWYHTGMGSTSVSVGQQSESVHVSTNLTFYACYPAGQCDHSYYGGFIEAEFDGTPDGSYSLDITVSFPAYGKTCGASKGITN